MYFDCVHSLPVFCFIMHSQIYINVIVKKIHLRVASLADFIIWPLWIALPAILRWIRSSEWGKGHPQGPKLGQAWLLRCPHARYIREWADHWVFFQTYIHIIDQRTRKPVPTKFYTDPMVVFHHVNAYEEDGCVVFDVIAYEDSSLYQLFYLANLNQNFEENSRMTSVPTLKRFAVPLHVDKVLCSLFSGQPWTWAEIFLDAC